ncbi:MAG TPA: MvaI/BcnI family restriction endonuclease [Patescibacteria group bacterium]|nr:MvaI/BcnI family restriction endonuclease [Patescibacteria group bacterium]
MQKWTLNEVKNKLKEVNTIGWISSNRVHDTGIGKTLEDLMGLEENNIALPDFGRMELKSQRAKTGSMITLFTKKPEGITNAEIRNKYGYPDRHFPNVKCLRQTLNKGKNAMGFCLFVDDKDGKVYLKKGNKKIGYYEISFIKEKAIEKIGNGLILVLAENKKESGKELFRFSEAYLLKDIDVENLIEYSKYDIRLGVNGSGKLVGKPHDHGSAFRIFKKDLLKLFKTHKKILG